VPTGRDRSGAGPDAWHPREGEARKDQSDGATGLQAHCPSTLHPTRSNTSWSLSIH
jgi:hypothetical protein